MDRAGLSTQRDRSEGWVPEMMQERCPTDAAVRDRYFAGHLGNDRLGGLHPATFLFIYAGFLVLAWPSA